MSTNWADLHRQVCFGQSNGKIIWQPRISCWFLDKQFDGADMPPQYAGMDIWDIHRALNCSARLYHAFNQCFKKVESEQVTFTERNLNETDTETTISTPVGKQKTITRRTPNSIAVTHLKREVDCEDELKVALWREENATYHWDQQHYEQALRSVGDLGGPAVYINRVTIQNLYLDKMGIENGIYAIYDWPDTVDAYFRALDDAHDRLIDVINASPIEIINFGDNIHCGTLPPELFCKYVLPSYHRRCDKLHSAGKFVYSHWDGDTKALLPYAKESHLDGIEAITPHPQGDVTLEEIKDALGDDLVLVDGIPAILFDDMYPVSMLEDCTYKLIELFAPKLILGISDEISSTGDIERVGIVGRIVEEYNRWQEFKQGQQ